MNFVAGQKGPKSLLFLLQELRRCIILGSHSGKDSASRRRCSVSVSGCHGNGNYPGFFCLKGNCKGLPNVVVCS